MVHVFVHGNPESEAVWWPLASALRERGINDIALLSPPGFGAPVPDGWDATYRSYRAWLIAQLEALQKPIHLVGHDWGAGHVLGVVAERPDLLASWATDCAGLIHPEYVWHDAAQQWQTPEVGEAAIAGMIGGSTADKIAMLGGLGISGNAASHMANAMNEAMAACVLALYRSAVQPALRQLGAQAEAAERRPGLFIIATEDHYTGTPDMARDSARRLGADTFVLEGAGHWWMVQQPVAAADALAKFWRSHASS